MRLAIRGRQRRDGRALKLREKGNMKVIATGAALAALALAQPALAADGKTVYGQTCAACHATGLANAPKLGDKAAWSPRASAGTAALVTNVVKGKGAMPPKAGNASLSEDDIRAAVEYMLGQLK
jgi:cytochrome c5